MENYHDQIGVDSRPNLCFDGIDALPIKRLDSKMLINPLEEQFNLPSEAHTKELIQACKFFSR